MFKEEASVLLNNALSKILDARDHYPKLESIDHFKISVWLRQLICTLSPSSSLSGISG